MAVRTLQVRLHCVPDTLEALWHTHKIFNERLREILALLFRMRRSECGESPERQALYREIALFVTGCPANNAPYLLNSVCIKNWVPTTAKKIKATISDPQGEMIEVTGESWAERAAQLSADGELLFDKREVLGDLTPAMAQVVVREAAAYLSGYESLVRRWEREHERWLDEKATWEAEPEHRLYLALKPHFTAFEANIGGGRLTERRHRWGQYITWLGQNPALAAWRGGPAVINDVKQEGRNRIARTALKREAQIEAEEFFKANPELKALDALHGSYERKFIRCRKTKKHIDGFDHKPTFTQPDALVHPRWYVFNAPQTKPAGYRKLNLPERDGQAGSLELSLMTGDNECHETAWTPFSFNGDRRLSNLRRVAVTSKVKSGPKRGEAKEKVGFEFFDRALKIWRPAEIKGARLALKMKGNRPRAAYLSFTVKTQNNAYSEAARNLRRSKPEELFPTEGTHRTELGPEGLVTCAVRIATRDCAYATLAVGVGGAPVILRQRNLWLEQTEATGLHVGRKQKGSTLAHMASHQAELARRRSQLGRIPRGESAHARLAGHIRNMAKDRYRQQARRIIDFALNVDGAIYPLTGGAYPRADVLLLESMENLIPSAELERGVNKALVAFNRGHLVSHLKDVAAEVGVRVFEINPLGTAQVCSRCGALGRPYSVRGSGKDQPVSFTFGPAEPLFACPTCHYRANSQHNASVNLHNRFYSAQTMESFVTYLRQPVERRREMLRSIEAELTSPTAGTLGLDYMHSIKTREYILTSG